MVKIIHDKIKCIGCGACTAVCPTNWVMDNNNKAKPKKTDISSDEIKCNKEAEQVCPVNCITIK
jgi:ferredoxin